MRNGSSDRSRSLWPAVYTPGRISPAMSSWAQQGRSWPHALSPPTSAMPARGYKDVLLHARQEDLRIIHSPVGMPARR